MWPFTKTKYYEHSWNFPYSKSYMVTKDPEPDRSCMAGWAMAGCAGEYKCREVTRQEYEAFNA